ncbi:helix-turn-helix domain-containing protein [Methylobacterium sp. E-005]|uniref:helix-turn-helix domain-containing protein n=1 Tax=Methylobacterium sp. E-005 TaxID=2836549 RepID=UPI001FB948BC|nr:helix-turn-helix transcriptional regulator [Methylobacterium sp. E-005]MCJ2086507.1 helix-turn-helix domain-containing protein [Methylobacterium sp. E-005]
MDTHISKNFGHYKAQKASMGRSVIPSQNAGMGKTPSEPLYPETGRRLRLLRLAIHEMDNQRAFAELHGFSHSQWNNYELGVSRPKPDDALRIKQKFGVTTDWIYDGSEAMMPNWLLEKMAQIERGPATAPKRTRRAMA